VQHEVGLRLDVHPEDAEVEIDGASAGIAYQLTRAVALTPGVHQIVIRRAGHETWRGEVEIKDRTETIQVRLEAVR
jgi:hypothetical protein